MTDTVVHEVKVFIEEFEPIRKAVGSAWIKQFDLANGFATADELAKKDELLSEAFRVSGEAARAAILWIEGAVERWPCLKQCTDNVVEQFAVVGTLYVDRVYDSEQNHFEWLEAHWKLQGYFDTIFRRVVVDLSSRA